jgi:hypothetical protein
VLQAGPAGAAKVELKGGGMNLPIPAPFDASHLIAQNPLATAQLVNRGSKPEEGIRHEAPL